MRGLLCGLVLCLLFSCTCLAAAEQSIQQAVPEGAKQVLTGVDTRGELGQGLWQMVKNALREADGQGVLATLARILAVALVCGVVCAFEGALRSAPLSRICRAAGGAAVFLLAAGDARSLLSAASQAVEELTVFSRMYTTVYTAACAAAGAPTAAAARQGVAVVATALFGELSLRLLLPACGLYAVISTMGVCLEQAGPTRLAGLLRSLFSQVLRTGLLLYSATITLTGALGAAADSLLKRGLKSGLAAAVPIVGGLLSETSEAVFAGASAVKNSIGTAGVLILVATVLLPCLRVGLWYAGMRLAAGLCALMGQESVCAVADRMAESMGMLFAVLTAVSAAQLVGVLAGILTFT